MFMLAYTFWHWRKASVPRHDYEARVQQFHLALRAHPSAGFSRSYSLAFIGAPWANAGAEAYEDWYLVEGSAALDPLNEAAISASRQVPHDAAAAAAAGGTAEAKAATRHKLASSLTVRAIRPRTDMRSILISSSCRSERAQPGGFPAWGCQPECATRGNPRRYRLTPSE